jgi:hypothetical protein
MRKAAPYIAKFPVLFPVSRELRIAETGSTATAAAAMPSDLTAEFGLLDSCPCPCPFGNRATGAASITLFLLIHYVSPGARADFHLGAGAGFPPPLGLMIGKYATNAARSLTHAILALGGLTTFLG